MTVSRLIVAFALAVVLGGPMVACSGSETSRSTGEYIDDTAVSNRVRAALIGDPDLNVFQIDVTTYQGVVQLSGFVDSTDAKARASRVAAGVEGVREVRNDLIVK